MADADQSELERARALTPRAARPVPQPPPDAVKPAETAAPDLPTPRLVPDQQAPVPTPAATPVPDRGKPAPRGKAEIEVVSEAVKQIEGRGVDMTTPAVRAAGGAVNGITPASAKESGFKPEERYDYDKALKMQRAELERHYAKYGNWSDALAAFDWGPGNVDKWIAKGRPVNLLPKETQDYLAKASRLTGMQLTTSGEGSYSAGKRELTLQDARDMTPRGDRPDPGGEEPDILSEDPIPAMDPSGLMTPEFGEQSAALVTGAVRSIPRALVGATQTGLEILGADEWDRRLTQMYNQFEEVTRLNNKMTQQHPTFATVGEIGGLTASILATGGWLGATKVGEAVGQVVQAIPKWVRAPGLGAVAAGTTFHPDVDEGNRWIEGGVGALFGTIGQTVAKSVGWATRYMGNQQAFQKFLATLQGSVGDLSKNTSKVIDTLLERYKQVHKTGTDLYKVRKAAGEDFEGFDPEQLSQAIKEAVPTEAREAGVSTTITTNKVKSELGLDAHEAAKAAHERAVADYEKAEAEWQKKAARAVPLNLPQATREQGFRTLVESGALPPRPVPPGDFVPTPVTPQRFAAAVQRINREAGSKLTDKASRRQLRGLKQALKDAGHEMARDAGMDGKAFMDSLERAEKHWREEVGPLADWFGGASPQDVASGQFGKKFITPATQYNKISSMLKRNDTKEMKLLGKVLTPAVKGEVVKIVEKEMLDLLTEGMKGKNPTKRVAGLFSDYIKDRKEGLIQLVGRDRVTELEGAAKLAEHLAQQTVVRKIWGWGTASFLPFIGAERIVEGFWHGDPVHGLKQGVGLIAAPFFVHGMHNILVKIHGLPYMVPGLRRMASMRPGTPEFERAVRQLEARIVGGAQVTGRAAVTEERGDTLQEAP